ncbi:UvrD-helicase domain-containing protein [Olleya aquimaris]|nr:UvrD-helicase domain-containing protein [Olleya aquimaris]
MSKTPSFKVYDASAGSGKTFALVKEYLKLLFTSTFNDSYKHILAITFTNKAVAEMKTRILDALQEFQFRDSSMFLAIVEELNLDPEYVRKKSKAILHSIMHNYAAFDVSTIDGFNHKLIRTFAHDLKIPINFEVELDTPSLLSQAVDSLIAKAGTNQKLTKILIDFAIEKADDDKSWDVSTDFNNIAKLLINDNDLPHVNSIKHKTLDDFDALKTQLVKRINTIEKQIVKVSENALSLIKNSGLEFEDFSGGKNAYIPKYFSKLKHLDISIDYSASWVVNLEEKPLYPKAKSDEIKAVLDAIKPEIVSAFNQTKAAVFDLKFLKAIYKNITPLSVLNAINKELTTIKEDENKLLISEFNSIISKEIKNQPTPFIYERLGEKFRHYFIDEFQDTSEMQWDNLIPLIENTLSGQNLKGEKGTAMIVGDAKQAIYRWRGGKAEQFIELTKDEDNYPQQNPFPVEKQVVNLKANYRSHKNIIQFNNQFFKYLSEQSFRNTDYSELYKKATQEPMLKPEGFVSIKFLDIQKEEDQNDIYSQAVFETVEKCLTNGYHLKDICVLVRKKKEGAAIAQFLSEKGIKITSSETMLIDNSEDVNLVVNIFRLLINPKNMEAKIKILYHVAALNNIKDKHHFFITHLALSIDAFFKSFTKFSIDVNPSHLLQLSLYDMAETIVRSFNLTKSSNAFIQYFLDVVLEFSQKQISDISAFLEYYDAKKENLNIVSPSNQDAIQIMTIHKSKGLEFPVVIFPYAQLDIYREKGPQEWFPLDKNEFNGFSKALLNFNKDFEQFGDIGEAIYFKHRSEQELDNINLLYVALTRPVEQLHIISKLDISKKDGVPFKTYSGLLINYLIHKGLWNEAQLEYSFGNENKDIEQETTTHSTIETQKFISVAKQDHDIKIITKSGYLWDTNQQQAIEKGNLIHDIMADIKTIADVEFVINDYLNTGVINKEQSTLLTNTITSIINHPEIYKYYTNNYTIYNERDILSKSGTIVRPDRLAIKDNDAVIIDYKTGLSNPKYQQQLEYYSDILKEMNFTVSKKILVYLNQQIDIVTY